MDKRRSCLQKKKQDYCEELKENKSTKEELLNDNEKRLTYRKKEKQADSV